MKKYIHLILILLITTSLSAQNIKRAYKSLEKKEYEKAKDSFSKLLSENSENVASNFGMAMVLADDQSTYFDIIDSWQYIEAIQGKENQLTQEELEIMGEYFLNTEVRKTSRPVKKKVEIAIEAVENRLIKYIREENDLEACYEVLERYPNFKYYDNVIHIRNQFEFRKYEKLNTFAGYEEFIQKFPDAAQVDKAKRYRNLMAFEEVKAKNTVTAYNHYLDKYPDSQYVQQAIKLRNAVAFSDAEKVHTLEAYENFITSYTDALEIPAAKKHQHQLMYEKAKRIKSLEAYNEFIRMYPDGGYYVDVFNLKSADLGMQVFRELNFDSPDFIWSRALDNNEYLDEAKAITSSSDGGYLIAGLTRQNDSSFADAWIIKLNEKGQMLWNKTIGQPYEDDILNIMETSKGEVIVVGYTKTSPDSAAKDMGWMFMLGNDGSRLWNKNLGETSISASQISSDDKIYIATYFNDTIPDNYFVQAYNLEGKKVAERDFVNFGHFNDILITPEQGVFLAGTEWFAYTDSKFYIMWEDTLKIDSKIVMADMNNNQIVLHARDSLINHLTGYSLSGEKKWHIERAKRDSTDQILDILLTSSNEILFLGQDLLNSYAIKCSSIGVQKAEKLISTGYRFKKVIRKKNGEIIYLLDGDDIVVISFSSFGF